MAALHTADPGYQLVSGVSTNQISLPKNPFPPTTSNLGTAILDLL
jgi:hypothetical protein